MLDPQTWRAFSPAAGSCQAALRDGGGKIREQGFQAEHKDGSLGEGTNCRNEGIINLFISPGKISTVNNYYNGIGELEEKFSMGYQISYQGHTQDATCT